MGYYKDDNSCKEVATITGTNLTIHDDTTTYVAGTNCTDDNRTFDKKYTCDDTQYGICRENAISCKDNDDLSSVCQGNITGTAPLSGSSYDFSKCICETSVDIVNGTGTKKCSFNSTGTEITTTNCITTISTCKSGYCSQNENTCELIPVGYYSVGDEVLCHKCPGGAKSPDEGGAISYESCYYDYQTVFTDDNGSFTIPMPVDAKINVNWAPKQN